MPVSRYYQGNGAKVMASMVRTYGPAKAERVIYATAAKSGSSPTPGTPGGGYKQTPDQRDRNEDHFRKAAGARPKVNPKKQVRKMRLPWHGKKPPGGLGNYHGSASSDRPRNS